MPEGYDNVALYENEAITEAVEAYNSHLGGLFAGKSISDSKKQLNKVYYRSCFAGVEYNFAPSTAPEFLIRVFVLLPGYSGSKQEAYEVDIFESVRTRTTNIATRVQGTDG